MPVPPSRVTVATPSEESHASSWAPAPTVTVPAPKSLAGFVKASVPLETTAVIAPAVTGASAPEIVLVPAAPWVMLVTVSKPPPVVSSLMSYPSAARVI